MEPSIVYLGPKQLPFDTHALTVIAGGRFKGINEIREKRLNGPKKMGFSSQESTSPIQSIVNSYIPEDLIEFGFLNEFVGRFSLFTEFKPLTFENCMDIIFAEDSILQQYLQVFHSRNVELYIDPINYVKIAEEASKSSTGARHLEMKLLELLLPLIYQVEQHYQPGCCEIDSDGKYYWLFEDGSYNL